MDDLIERLEAGVTAIGLHDDNETELYDIADADEAMFEAAAELRTLRAELERRKYDGVHTCHAECQREACVLRREVDALRAERDEALAKGVAMGIKAAAVAYEAEARTWVQLPMQGACLRSGLKAIRALSPAAIIAGDADLVCGTLGDSDGDDGA